MELKKLRSELQDRSRTVLDKRELLELEEGKRQAEMDKLDALKCLEQLSEDLQAEKVAKSRLESRIEEMASQLLTGGVEIQNSPAFKIALKQEQSRIKKEYESKLADIEKDRESLNEEKAQTDRWKAVLSKQRDIMIQLTARLNERDQTVRLSIMMFVFYTFNSCSHLSLSSSLSHSLSLSIF